MNLSNDSILKDKEQWIEKQYQLPLYDRQEIKKNTLENPNWIHMGAGNIFRAFQANALEELLNNKKASTGLIVLEGYDYEIIKNAYNKFDDLGIFVKLKSDGSIEKRVVGSVVSAMALDETSTEFAFIKELFRKPSLQMVSFTITEKGYVIKDKNGDFVSYLKVDLEREPIHATSYLGKLTALIYERFKAGSLPLALVSMDNCSHNGDKLKEAVISIATEWQRNGFCEREFLDYLNDEKKITFPWSMIDKITPRPDDAIRDILKSDGIEDMDAFITSKHTYVAPFVNAEETEYLVIEDKFPNGRPCLEEAGIIFTDRETVDKVEKMKVCTCLNPLHTALAVFGCLLGYKKISDEMLDEDLTNLIKKVGYKESLPVVVDPIIINPKDFIDTVIEVRLPNPFMPDTPQRIACDTSQKLGIRFGETLKAYLKSDTLDIKDIKLIPLVYAGWCRYIMGLDDNGNVFELSPDPLLEKVTEYVKDIKLGDNIDVHKVLYPILSDKTIFGLDLYEAGIASLSEEYFAEMIKGAGAVRTTLHKYTA